MTKEEIAKRFCKFELCTHRNGEGMCCLYNQDNCIFHRLEKENAELKGIKDVVTLIRANNDTVVTLMQLNNKLVSKSQQLTIAKDLIHQFLIQNPISDWLPKKAEQFLKEGEECRLQNQLMKNTKN